MFDTMHEYTARIEERPDATVSIPSSRVLHAAAIVLRHFDRELITLDDTIHIEEAGGWESGTATVRQALEWVLTQEAADALRDEPFGFHEELVDFANRILDVGETQV